MKSETVSVAKLKSELSRYLAKARGGQTIEVTSHRKIIARLIGVPDNLPARFPAGLAQMVADGKLSLGNGETVDFEAPVKVSEGGPLVSEIVLQNRDPR